MKSWHKDKRRRRWNLRRWGWRTLLPRRCHVQTRAGCFKGIYMRRTSLSYSMQRNGTQRRRQISFFRRSDVVSARRCARSFGILRGRPKETGTYRHLQSEMIFKRITEEYANMNSLWRTISDFTKTDWPSKNESGKCWMRRYEYFTLTKHTVYLANWTQHPENFGSKGS